MITNKQRAKLVGVLILVAYSMLIYSITKNLLWGFITDIASGLAVIGIPLLMFPIFNSKENRKFYYVYLTSRFIEGMLMIVGGFFILFPSFESHRDFIYGNIHIYFFISGAIFFYLLFYRTKAIPLFISIWGMIATLILLIITINKLFGIDLPVFQILIVPIILNELFLAVWLMIKGINIRKKINIV